jgi:hypothetical protein
MSCLTSFRGRREGFLGGIFELSCYRGLRRCHVVIVGVLSFYLVKSSLLAWAGIDVDVDMDVIWM